MVVVHVRVGETDLVAVSELTLSSLSSSASRLGHVAVPELDCPRCCRSYLLTSGSEPGTFGHENSQGLELTTED